jgi:hypothetical protein
MATGWGREGWGTDIWGGTSVSITLTGLEATSALGTLTSVTGEANISVNGLAGTSQLGNITLVTNNNISVTGLSVTGEVSGVGVNAQAVATLPSLVSSVGTVSVQIQAEANVTPYRTRKHFCSWNPNSRC